MSKQEERLSKTEFAELIPHLNLQDLLKTEFRKGADWRFLIVDKKKLYDCALCGVTQSGSKNLYAHLEGKKHRVQMQTVDQLYHAEYTNGKGRNVKNIPKTTKPNLPVQQQQNNKTPTPTATPTSSQPAIAKGTSNANAQNGPATIKVESSDGKITPAVNVPIESQNKSTLIRNPYAVGVQKNTESNNAKGAAVAPAVSATVVSAAVETVKTAAIAFDDDVIVIDDDNAANEKEKTAKQLENNNDNDDVSKEPSPKRQKLNSSQAKNVGKSQSNDDNNSNYQADIVVTPTVHKKPSNVEKSENAKKLTFTVKDFMSDPTEDVSGLIGVEYVIKIIRYPGDKNPRFECGLCELTLDGYNMQNHLLGYNHKLKFCERHFPTALNQAKQFMDQLPEHEVYKVLTPVLGKVAVAIEKHHGRDLPFECSEREFQANRSNILSKVFSCRHASEKHGPTFTQVINAKEIDELIATRHKYKPAAVVHGPLFDKDVPQEPPKPPKSQSRYQGNLPGRLSTHQQMSNESFQREYPTYMQSNFVQPPQPPQPLPQQQQLPQPQPQGQLYPIANIQPRFQRTFRPEVSSNSNANCAPIDNETHKMLVEDFLRGKNPRSTSRPYEKRHDSTSHPYRSSNYGESRSSVGSRPPLTDNDTWEAYERMVEQKLQEINDNYKIYRSDPEKHPQYSEEWEKFWRRRKDELVAAGIDHRSHNYQPEWVRFFKTRIKDLHTEAIEDAKTQARQALLLAKAKDDNESEHRRVQAQQEKITPKRVDKPTRHKETTPEQEKVKEIASKRSYDILDKKKTPVVISVLRLMTALEEHLGSLGPKVLELLSKALQVEKTESDKLNSRILTVQNCAMLETAMEKFKGLVFAGLLDGTKERAMNEAIEGIRGLLDLGEEEQKKNQPTIPAANQSLSAQLLSSIGDQRLPAVYSAVNRPTLAKSSAPARPSDFVVHEDEKNKMASKLAAILTAQGKTDFKMEELQELVAVYSLIEKKKREAAGTSATTANEVSMAKKSALPDTIKDLLSNASFNSNNNVPQSRSNFNMNPYQHPSNWNMANCMRNNLQGDYNSAMAGSYNGVGGHGMPNVNTNPNAGGHFQNPSSSGSFVGTRRHFGGPDFANAMRPNGMPSGGYQNRNDNWMMDGASGGFHTDWLSQNANNNNNSSQANYRDGNN